MLPAVFVCIFFLCGVSSQVVFTVFPPIVEPGFTPSFTLSCSVPEQEEGQIVSLSISRRAVTARQAKVSPKDRIVELRGPAPGRVTVSPGFENITAQGQITLLEVELVGPEVEVVPQVFLTPQQAELAAIQEEIAAIRAERGTYLEVIWPAPKVEDLGVYTCEVTSLGIATGQTLFAEVKVTTSNAVTDMLLVTVLEMEEEADAFNKTLSGVQSEIDSITTALKKVKRTGNDSDTEEQATTEPDSFTIEVPDETSTDGPTEGNHTDGPASQEAGADLKRLAVALENLEAKFERFNDTLNRLNKIITILEEKVDDSAVNETSEEQAIFDEVRHYFIIVNASYVLFQTNINATTKRVQDVCDSKRLHLAEFQSAEEVQAISDEIAPYVQDGGLVLVGGQKTLGQDVWVFQNSQQSVNFFPSGPPEKGEANGDECLALAKSKAGWSNVPVACSSDQNNVFFLCQQD